MEFPTDLAATLAEIDPYAALAGVHARRHPDAYAQATG